MSLSNPTGDPAPAQVRTFVEQSDPGMVTLLGPFVEDTAKYVDSQRPGLLASDPDAFWAEVVTQTSRDLTRGLQDLAVRHGQ